MKKIAFIVPGFGNSGKEKEYQKIAGFFEKRNIKPVIARISWKRHTLLQNAQQAREQLAATDLENTKIYLLGFSFGAMKVFLISSEIKIESLVLCSLSPYFKEDMPGIKKWWRNMLGKRRTKEFEGLLFGSFVSKIYCKTTILYGNKEGIEVEKRAEDAQRKIKNSQLIVLGGVRHDISDEVYLDKIEKVINKF